MSIDPDRQGEGEKRKGKMRMLSLIAVSAWLGVLVGIVVTFH